MRHSMRLTSAALLATSLATAAQAESADERALARLDAAQKDMVARADVDGLARVAGPELVINAPTGRVLDHDRFLAMMRSGQIGAEAFERTAEKIVVSGDLGIVMGGEVFTPTANSELGRMYGAKPLHRRFTNDYVRRQGKWRWVARHANVVPAG